MPRKKAPTKPKAQLRIIGGKWRGRKLAIADVEGLRPTGDRIRETLFNWLQADISNARCLDLFAGAGALGLEALSRGAQSVTMIEYDATAAANLTAHCQLLEIDSNACKLIKADAIRYLSNENISPGSIDIVFIDPPFAANLWQSVIDLLEQQSILADDALIYIESPKNRPITPPTHWHSHREKTAGDVRYQLFKPQQ